MSAAGLVLEGWLGAGVFMTFLWLVQRRTGNAAIVDVGWTALVGLLHAFDAARGGGWPGRSLLLASLVGLWSARLATHLIFSRLLGHPEEGRYQELRAQWGPRAQRNLLAFFQAQALAAVLLTAPYLAVYLNPAPAIGLWEKLGLGLFLLGLAGESLADQQLRSFKADPARAGQVCQVGLWNYSRHPNYFFELVMWAAWSTYALGSPGGRWAFLSPTVLLGSVLFVTGIPPTEAQALRSRGEAYREYQRTTSALVPWFKKRS